MATDKTIHDDQTAKAFILSGDPNKAMQQMMDTIDSLREVYREENDALSHSDTKRFLSLQDRKIEIARNYQDGAQQLLERKSDLKKINLDLKDKLVDMQSEFSGLMSENLKQLDRMRRGVNRLNDKIMTSARESARTKNVNYSQGGNLNLNERSVSIGLNESA